MSESKQQKKIASLFVTYLGLGLSPKAPGTVGSLGALPLVFLLAWLGWPYYFSATIIFIALSLWLCAVYIRGAGNQDPKEVVVDEVAGILITFFLVPLNWQTVILGFALFRFLDIVKPPPISTFERRVPGAAGVMMDDIVAGFFVNMAFHYLLLPMGWV